MNVQYLYLGTAHHCSFPEFWCFLQRDDKDERNAAAAAAAVAEPKFVSEHGNALARKVGGALPLEGGGSWCGWAEWGEGKGAQAMRVAKMLKCWSLPVPGGCGREEECDTAQWPEESQTLRPTTAPPPGTTISPALLPSSVQSQLKDYESHTVKVLQVSS